MMNLFRKKRNRQIIFGLVIIISLLFIIRVIFVNWTELSQQSFEIDYRYLVLSVLLYPLGMLPTVAAWHFLLRSIDIKISFFNDLRIYTFTLLPRHIPGMIWHVSSRSVLYEDIDISGKRILVATGLETVFLTLTGSIASFMWFFLINNDDRNFQILKIVAIAALVGTAAFFFLTRGFNQTLNRLQSRFGIQQPIQINNNQVVISFFWMFLAWIGGGVILFILAKGFHPVSVTQLPSIIGIWGAAGAISLSIGALIQGLGLREITLAAMLSTIFPVLTAAIIAIAFRLVLTMGEVLWVLLFSRITKTSSRRSEDASSGPQP